MLLILSEKGDLSTNDVIDWLITFQVPHVRLNCDESQGVELSLKSGLSGVNIQVKTENVCISLDEVSAYWYRRGGIPQFKIPPKSIDDAFPEAIRKKIKEYLNLESHALYEYLHDYLDKIPNKIGSWNNSGVNKISVLHKAKELGLKTPSWLVSMNTTETIGFINEHNGNVITKGLWESLIASTTTSGYNTFTELISMNDLKDYPSKHFPSMLQQCIIKKYEIRSFYLNGNFWSMAIFSQADSQTSIDFRKYNEDKPNRNVPYKLPIEIKSKLVKLMEYLKLETGSIDIIVDDSDNYVFLEVNPVGQFGMTSSPCNYFLEKEIANHFKIQLDSKNNYEKV